jgi:hypothetical protein
MGFPLLLPAALLAGVVVALWSAEGRASNATRGRVASGTDLEAVKVAGTLALRRPEPPAPAPVPAPAVAAHAQTAGEFLADWHGDRWPAVAQALSASGFDLDQPYTQRPWEQVAPAFEQRIGLSPAKRAALVRAHGRWPERLDVDFVRASFPAGRGARPVDAADIVAIADLVAPANADIAARAELYGDLLDLHVHERWRTGRYERAPVTTAGLGEQRGFHSESHGGDGWAVTITLKREECPDLMEIEQQIALLCRERDELVMQYLRDR